MFIKPYQPVKVVVCQPPLGILYVAASLRSKLGAGNVDIRICDFKLSRARSNALQKELEEFPADIIGISALSFEAEEAAKLALQARELSPHSLIVLGGPHAHSEKTQIAESGLYDWVFYGEADYSFAETVGRWQKGQSLEGVDGLIWRSEKGYSENPAATPLKNLDAVPMPAWDLVDFDAYARQPNQNTNLRGRRYAPIFTSRGCPYKCTYCHDIFGRKFRFRSADNVLAEIEHLQQNYGVDEFQIIDDIFNFHRPRLFAICKALKNKKVHLCFPNGLRADLLTKEIVDALVDAGTYQTAIAVETVTPRLQELIRKDLNIPRVQQAIGWLGRRGVIVKGFFMIGFPTETVEEIKATIDFAIKSDLTFAGFFLVIPQRGTPMFDLARDENREAIEKVLIGDYYSASCWYREAYGIEIQKLQRNGYLRFYLSRPKRILRIIRSVSLAQLMIGFGQLSSVIVSSDEGVTPDVLAPLRKVDAN